MRRLSLIKCYLWGLENTDRPSGASVTPRRTGSTRRAGREMVAKAQTGNKEQAVCFSIEAGPRPERYQRLDSLREFWFSAGSRSAPVRPHHDVQFVDLPEC